ncbi:MAG TPA: PEGA domain-containing protein [Polyangia bacterium]|nr:PEGA domain-containing protein [Polyangia bacterium]
MTRSAVVHRTSPAGSRLVSSGWGIALLAVLFGATTLLSARPALAKRKKSAEPAQATDEAAPGEKSETPAAPAAQVGDTEKPKTILDTSQEAPKTDSLGHVHFGSPNAEGLGRVAVKAAPESKIKIFLEGRYFGTAPLTIYSVPKGDYIVEAAYPNGKQISKPVSVGENEETAIDLLGPAAANAASSGPGMFDAEMTPGRMTLTKVALVVAAVGVVAAVTFGILELKTESDYEKALNQQQKDDLENKGNRYALLTNLGIVTAAVGLVGAGIAGYPLVLRPSEKSKTAFIFTPAPTATGGGATMTVRF